MGTLVRRFAHSLRARGISALILSSLLVSRQSALADEPALYLQSGEALSASATALHLQLAANWPRYQHMQKFDRAGLLQILLGVIGKRPIFPYFAGLRSSRSLRFINFGADGFFLGKAREPESERQSQQDAASHRSNAFEKLAWGVTYLNPATVNRTSFLRHQFVKTHGTSEASRAFRSLQADPTVSAGLREAYALVWSGSLHCLALAKGVLEASRIPPWHHCEPQASLKLQDVENLDNDEQFFTFLSGRPREENHQVCKATGISGRNGIEGFGVIGTERARCIFASFPYEDPWGKRSKVHCHLPLQSAHLWRNFDHVDFVFPSAHPERFVLVESRFDPPRVTRLILDQAETLPEISRKAANPLAERTGSGFGGLPQGEFGTYQCVSRSLGSTQLQTFFVDPEIYLGRRLVNEAQDLVHFFAPSRDHTLSSATMLWREIMEQYPALDRFPEISCAYELSLDVKCGIRVLQTAAQIISEERSQTLKEVSSPAVRHASLKLLQSLLTRVERGLPEWGLKRETLFIQQKIELALSGPHALKSPIKRFETESPWRRYLSLPPDFWNE